MVQGCEYPSDGQAFQVLRQLTRAEAAEEWYALRARGKHLDSKTIDAHGFDWAEEENTWVEALLPLDWLNYVAAIEDGGPSDRHYARAQIYAWRDSILPAGVATYSERAHRHGTRVAYVHDGNHRAYAAALRGCTHARMFMPESHFRRLMAGQTEVRQNSTPPYFWGWIRPDGSWVLPRDNYDSHEAMAQRESNVHLIELLRLGYVRVKSPCEYAVWRLTDLSRAARAELEFHYMFHCRGKNVVIDERSSETTKWIEVQRPRSNRGGPSELAIVDFDHSLFRSPQPPPGSNDSWWTDALSLYPPTVPIYPTLRWWVMPTVQAAQKSINEAYTILLTGRLEEFRPRIEHLLSQVGLHFDAVHLSPGDNSTLEYKQGVLQRYLDRWPGIRVKLWDDRPEILNGLMRTARDNGSEVTAYQVTAEPLVAGARANPGVGLELP